MVNVTQLDDCGLVIIIVLHREWFWNDFAIILGTLGLAGSSIEEMVFSSTAGFYSLYKGQLKRHLTNVGLSNGVAWNDPLKKFYHIDSWAGTISEFDFDAQTETICNIVYCINSPPQVDEIASKLQLTNA